MSWTDGEYQQAVAWRGLEPPLEYSEIARRLGGRRSPEAVRQKLISERLNERIGGRRTRTEWREHEITGPCLGERVFLRRLMAGGGHSRFTEVARNPDSRQAYWALTLPLIGPDGWARPCARADCQCIAGSGQRECAQ